MEYGICRSCNFCRFHNPYPNEDSGTETAEKLPALSDISKYLIEEFSYSIEVS
jgi:hypothetical protein